MTSLEGPGRELTTVCFDHGSTRPCEGLLAPITRHQRSDLAALLGAIAAPPGPLAADAIDVESMLRTSAADVSAAETSARRCRRSRTPSPPGRPPPR